MERYSKHPIAFLENNMVAFPHSNLKSQLYQSLYSLLSRDYRQLLRHLLPPQRFRQHFQVPSLLHL